MTTPNELTVVLYEDELQDYLAAGIPLEQLRMATPAEVAEFEQWQQECDEEDSREQEFNAVIDAMDPCWSINDYENLIAEHMIDDLDDDN